mmetsp:Transcript_27469/g.110029  ORF Transcript_27469/g.110029 Transcript_27469/m.110029 type:complete len:84 (+) Transcript_27469:591-842(+)
MRRSATQHGSSGHAPDDAPPRGKESLPSRKEDAHGEASMIQRRRRDVHAERDLLFGLCRRHERREVSSSSSSSSSSSFRQREE